MQHVVFGAGAVGSALARHLAGIGERVTAVSRSGRQVEGAEAVAGDAADGEFVASVVRGSDVVYQCLNPPYHRWPELFPPLQRSVMDAARTAGAKLVSFENLYMYGPTGGEPVTEDLPYAATGRKGRVRGQMATEPVSYTHLRAHET